MERSEAIYLFEDSKNRIKWFLRDIDEDINGSNRLVFKGKVSVQLYDIAENVGKVVNYIRDGKRDADRLKSELLSLRSMVKELQSKTLQKGYEHFAYNCRLTISIIDNMEKWETSEPIQKTTESEIIPETGDNDEVYYEIFDGVEEKYINKYKKSFNYDEDKYTSFFEECKGKTPYEIAGMLYNCNDFYNCRAIKAIYFVCVVPTMTDDNCITYETFLNHYNSIDGAQNQTIVKDKKE